MVDLRRNISFVRLFLGRLITNAGDSLYLIGAMWLVYDLTGSSFYTGLAGFLIQLPSGLQFLVGPLVDRWELRRLLVATQVIQGVFVLTIPLAAMTGYLSVWLLLAVMPALSFVNQFVYPAQNAALPQIVDEDQLVRANSLFSTAYQGAEVVFNAAGGLILAVVGATTLFALDSVTFAVAAVLFFGVSVPDSTHADDDADDAEESDENYFAELWEGITYLRGSVLLLIVVGMMLANLGAGAIMAVLPAFADSMGGPETYGLLMAALAGGPLIGAVTSSLVEDLPYGSVSIVGYSFSGLFLGAAAIIPGLAATVVLFLVSFVPIGTLNVMFPSILQSSADEALLGRVSSVMSSVSMVMLPAGYLIGGAGGDIFGPALVLVVFAAAYVLVGFYFLVHPRLRSLPAVADANEGTLGLGSPSDP